MEMNQKQEMIKAYVAAYNTFDVEGMLTVLHADVEFINIDGGATNTHTKGQQQFRALAEQSRQLFSERNQEILSFQLEEEPAAIEVDFTGVFAIDLPSGFKKGDKVEMKGRSEFEFADGKIALVRDIA